MVLAIAAPCTVLAQTQDDARKEHKEVVKQSKKEAKRLKKEGWQIYPADIPLEKQLERSYTMQSKVSETGSPVYVVAEATSVCMTYRCARNFAIEIAKGNLVGLIQKEIIALVEKAETNGQLSTDEAASIMESVTPKFSLHFDRISPIVEIYRGKSESVEVFVRLVYGRKMALEESKKVIREDLEKKGKDLHEQLDKIFDF